MRLFLLIPAVFVFASPATAQDWQEYSYPDYSFRVTFPASPQVEITTYQVSNDRAVEAHVYSVHRDSAEFKVTVAELAGLGIDETAVINHAIKTLSEGGEVKVNIPHRISRVYGRQLSILQGGGTRAEVALFDYNGRLYQVEGKSLATGVDADAIRFVQSLIFTGGGSNRTADQILAEAAACGGQSQPGVTADDSRGSEIRCRGQQSLAALLGFVNSGDLLAAQRAYALLSQAQNNGQGRFAIPNGPFAQAINQIGQALQSGDLTGAQQALSLLRRGQGGRTPPAPARPDE
jgi:hypothetical protein